MVRIPFLSRVLTLGPVRLGMGEQRLTDQGAQRLPSPCRVAAQRKHSDNCFDQVLCTDKGRLNSGESLLLSDLGCVFFSISCQV